MTKKHSTKRSLIASILVLCLCLSTLIGTTFAWFTDSVTSGGNIIKSGTLDVTMEWFDGTKAVPDADSDDWTDASTGAIFEYDLWEPGYVAVRHIKIANEGTLALKYSLKIVTEDEVGKLAEVIDVYYTDPAVKLERDALTPDKKLGTLAEILADLSTASGNLMAGENHTITLALKMQESAGNEYQDKQVAASFAIQLLATQLTAEEDSFDDQYDKDAEGPIVPVYPATTADELVERLENALPGEEIFVAAGTFELSSALSIPNGVTLYGAQAGVAASKWVNDASAEKTVIKYTGASGANVLEIRQTSDDLDKAVSDIEINGILIDCNSTASKGIYIRKSGGEAIENVKIVNCAVINSANDGIDAGHCYGAVIENNYVSGVVDNAIRLGNYNGYHWQTWEEVTSYVRNNVIDGVSASENGAIQLENGMGDVVVSGNVIRNVVAKGAPSSSSVKASAIHVYDVYEGGEIVIENNTIENADQGIAIYKYTYSTVYGEDWWEGPTSDNDGIVISGNKISGYDAFAITTSKLNAEGNSANTTVVEIKNNVITDGADANAIVIRNENSGWNVVTEGNKVNGATVD